jgi:hypothetical protein
VPDAGAESQGGDAKPAGDRSFGKYSLEIHGWRHLVHSRPDPDQVDRDNSRLVAVLETTLCRTGLTSVSA